MPKGLDHRTSKTYDIKPVDKRGRLDIARLEKGEELVQLGSVTREEKAAQILNRFKQERKRFLVEKLIFDIDSGGTKEVVSLKSLKAKDLTAKTVATLQQETSIETKSVGMVDKQEAVKKDNNLEAENAQSPEEVLERFRKTFTAAAENKQQSSATANKKHVTEKTQFSLEDRLEAGKVKTELKPEKYSVLQGNQILDPNSAPELQLAVVKRPKEQTDKFNRQKEAVEQRAAKITSLKQWLTDEKQKTDLAVKRALTIPTKLANKKHKSPETEKEHQKRQRILRRQRTEEAKLFWQKQAQDRQSKQETRQKKQPITEAQQTEGDTIERIIRKKSRVNEPIIENKLNAWFKDGAATDTVADKNTLLDRKQQKKRKELVVNKIRQVKSAEKADKAADLKPKRWQRFFSLNYRKNGEDFHWSKLVARPIWSFVATSIIAFLTVGLSVFISYGFQIQEEVKVKGQQALGYLDQAKNQLKDQDFLSAQSSFISAVTEFETAQQELDRIGGDMLNVFSTLPFLSRVSSGKNVVDAGNELTKAAKELAAVIEILAQLENPFSVPVDKDNEGAQQSILEIFLLVQEKLEVANQSLRKAEEDLSLVKVADLPEEYREKFQKIQEILPIILALSDTFEQNSEIFLELLGHNGPRKYLLIFQNNQEMRATGGFIGSYGILHISDGKIKKLLIEGIYNPDGQLKYDIVPPLPIQKISAGWSTHDANWFPHFPKTAEKIAMFYEYTGGPTVDGIITVDPVVLQMMLAITGPITMEEYGTVVDEDNFIQATQYEVEVDYDKAENRPKQFLADLAPKIITELFAAQDPGDAAKILEMFTGMLKERHIVLHSFNGDIQQVISQQGWSGEILQTEKDYLMVVNSNINGFKTDGVVDETITHNAQVAEDGTIINTVKIKRFHKGGDTDYEWWNKVNCDYMRVYVPKGSRLLSVKGQTREINESPLDYDKLGFKRDKDVVREEEGIKLDEETGTRIYEEEEKTVFANWVYVSPKETVEIEYKYELPFKLDIHKNEQAADTYSLLVQKQSGSVGSDFSSTVEYKTKVKPVWLYPQDIKRQNDILSVDAKLTTDLFFGAVFQGGNSLEQEK